MSERKLVVKHSHVEGRQVYQVPLIPDPGHECTVKPRLPEGLGNGYNYYTSDHEMVCVAADEALAKYLSQRAYATFVGEAEYHPYGIDHYEWNPNSTYFQQRAKAFYKETQSYHARNEIVPNSVYSEWLSFVAERQWFVGGEHE